VSLSAALPAATQLLAASSASSTPIATLMCWNRTMVPDSAWVKRGINNKPTALEVTMACAVPLAMCGVNEGGMHLNNTKSRCLTASGFVFTRRSHPRSPSSARLTG
jgi:hypothetical protein